MQYDAEQIGKLVRKARTNLGLTQKDVARAAGTGLRFIIDLERGKPTCQLGKTLLILNTLGIHMNIIIPEQEVHG